MSGVIKNSIIGEGNKFAGGLAIGDSQLARGIVDSWNRYKRFERANAQAKDDASFVFNGPVTAGSISNEGGDGTDKYVFKGPVRAVTIGSIVNSSISGNVTFHGPGKAKVTVDGKKHEVPVTGAGEVEFKVTAVFKQKGSGEETKCLDVVSKAADVTIAVKGSVTEVKGANLKVAVRGNVDNLPCSNSRVQAQTVSNIAGANNRITTQNVGCVAGVNNQITKSAAPIELDPDDDEEDASPGQKRKSSGKENSASSSSSSSSGSKRKK